MEEPKILKILVVDDEPDVEWLFRQGFRREVRSGQLELTFAHSGEEALTYLRSGGGADVVLVLSDINMPGMTGFELLCRIKEEFGGLPVHMITAYGDEQNRSRAIAYGADGYLVKPLDFSILRNKVFRLAS